MATQNRGMLLALVLVMMSAVAIPLRATRSQERAAAPVAAAPAGNADDGQRLYVRYGCYQCHGRQAQGSPETGPRLGPGPLPFAGFVRAVRTPRNQMPPYSKKVVSDEQLTDIYAFLRTRPAASPKSVLPPD